MYLNLIKSKLKSSSYDSLQTFNRDVHLLFDNCILYNGEGSYFGMVSKTVFYILPSSSNMILPDAQYAIGMRKEWENKFATLCEQLPSFETPVVNESKTTAEPLGGNLATSKSTPADSAKPLIKQKVEESKTIAQVIGPILWEEWQYITFLDCLDVFATEVRR